MNSRDRQAWIIAVGLFISLFFLWGSGYNTSPVFLSALLKAFGWSHSKAAWLPSVLVLAVGITGPMTGWLLDHFDARAIWGRGRHSPEAASSQPAAPLRLPNCLSLI
jgi:fucose permease